MRKITFTLSLFCTAGRAAALVVSCLSWETIAPCVFWMSAFAKVLKKYDITEVLPSVGSGPEEARHLIQSHCVSLEMLVS